ncbi:hypothetical protein E4Z66_09195 [Aliishimia ponticola]|uniref:Hedgehog/Intein (Hint) domain-containing protein n=1 Tax=Aliishimia ponticola TaxID=2499833 RepID=A0A4S4NCK0_9RHOB|nr:Hint domain-containing protein [Aliishimia ponticola]THH37099.1 hypothetical protein E4Z66_09195 [Aliishimia ponticola]
MFGWTTLEKEAPRRVAEPSGAFETESRDAGHALVAGTRIATGLGWRPIETVRRGDQVLTFDNGLQRVADVRRTSFRAAPSNARGETTPVIIPAGALGNRVEMRLLPGQGVLVESDEASDAMGDPFALVPAHTLVGYRNICHDAQTRDLEVVTICFDKPQVIYAEAGTLIYCPQATVDLLDVARPTYELLDIPSAEEIVNSMILEDITGASRQRELAAGFAA